jgi:bifunctional non-homologous end joining protein LigD
MSRFLVHRHAAGKAHFDLRLDMGGTIRSWSLYREPPVREGDRRLAIELQLMTAEAVNREHIEEEPFGSGRARIWDGGKAGIAWLTPSHLVLDLRGAKLSGRFELRRMRWYPGNRWLLEKTKEPDRILT